MVGLYYKIQYVHVYAFRHVNNQHSTQPFPQQYTYMMFNIQTYVEITVK